jgi:LPS export ABC transporter protein LptC
MSYIKTVNKAKVIPVIFIAGIVFYSCSNELEQIQAVTVDKNAPSETTEGVDMLYTDNGKSTLRMQSPRVDKFDDESNPRLEWPLGLEVTFYDSLQQVESVLKANYGILYQAKGYMMVKNDVVFSNNKNERLNTEQLHLYFERDSVYTDKFFTITSETGKIAANELISNLTFTKYKFNKVENSEVYIDDQEEE